MLNGHFFCIDDEERAMDIGTAATVVGVGVQLSPLTFLFNEFFITYTFENREQLLAH
jgi:hypothetical protein